MAVPDDSPPPEVVFEWAKYPPELRTRVYDLATRREAPEGGGGPWHAAALVVASSSYTDSALQELQGPRADAAALADVLRDEAIGGFDVDLLADQPSADVRLRIARFFKDRKSDDLLLLYFSGHGLKDQDGRLYFATTDTDRSVPEATAVSADFVNDVMQRSSARTQVLLLDCCFSGAFARGFAAKGDETVHTAETFEAPTGTGRVVLTASAAIQYAFEGDRTVGTGTGSVFTRHLIEGLRTGGADMDGDGEIAVGELYSYVYDRVTAELPSQRPEKFEWGLQGNLYIAHNASVEEVQLPPDIQHTLASATAEVRIHAVDQLAWLATGQKRRMADAARAALVRLTDDDSRRVREAAQAALDGLEGAPTTPRPSEPPPLEPPREPALVPGSAALPPGPPLEPPRPPDAAEPAASGPKQWSKGRIVAVAAAGLVVIGGIVGLSIALGGDDDGGGSEDSSDSPTADGTETQLGFVSVDGSRDGELTSDDQPHVYDFTGIGSDVVVTVTPTDGDLDVILAIYDADGEDPGEIDDGVSGEPETATIAGDYEDHTIEVYGYLSETGTYNLGLAAVAQQP